MGLAGFSNDDDEEETTEKSDASKTYVHFYESHHEDIQSLDEDIREVIGEAYDLAQGSGAVRNFFNNQSQYENHVHAYAEFTVGMGEALEGDFNRAISFLLAPESDDDEVRKQEAEFYADQLANWLDKNTEVGEILVDRIMTHEDNKGEESEGE